jgi:BirA family transcriptional regulator, biotin operon repressor / biotin---[acetyl-CoA-carboxylase] ligase
VSARASVPTASIVAATYDGCSAEALAELCGVARVVVFDEVGSTLDVAHSLGENGGDAGTLVLADAQTAGRGRLGRSWRSEPGAGIWLTLLERPRHDDTLGVLALRIALALAPALDAFAGHRIQLKWPNDLYVNDAKLAGVLVEARWRGPRLDWLALGVGINVRPPAGFGAAGLAQGSSRVDVLRAVVPALRTAASMSGQLTNDEIADFALRDLAAGRRCVAPIPGVIVGIRPDGALLVDGESGRTAVLAGSLVLDSDNSLR